MQQRVHIATAADRVQIAWARAGAGPVLVKAANWLTHLRHDPGSPVWRHWIAFLARHFDFIRYDERGCGLSQREDVPLGEDTWLGDLECVVADAGVTRPMILLGVSQGALAVVQFAVRHPERVSHLILYGGYSRGWATRGGADDLARYRAVLDMMRVGWGRDNPVFRQAFTSRFIPGGSHEQLDWFNALCRQCIAPDMAVRLLEARSRADISTLLPRVRVPTLVMHASGDEVVPVAEGRRLAASIPGAQFVELDSRNHVLLAHEPAWQVFQQEILAFTGARGIAQASEPLTRRQREITELLCSGLPNAEIGRRVGISEKTVRNQLSTVYRKLGVASRAEAIVRLRDTAA